MSNHGISLLDTRPAPLPFDDLREAIDGGSLALHYQPIVDLHTNAITGFEALVRLPHPTFGLLSAADFVPLAEQWGLNRPLDEWVLWTACQQLAAWQDDVLVTSAFHMAINVSGSEVDCHSLAPRMARAISASGVGSSSLVAEFTESQDFEHAASAHSASKLHELGVRIALDDFGSSYATFARLRSLDFDIVKIDRSVTAFASTALGAGLIRAIVAECHDLGATIVAEGIETTEQAQIVRALGCDLGQGYLWAPALPAQEAENLLSAPRPMSPVSGWLNAEACLMSA